MPVKRKPKPKGPTWTVQIKLNANDWTWYHGVTKFKQLYLWLDKHKPDWRFGNVYFNRVQVGSFTKFKRPDDFPTQ